MKAILIGNGMSSQLIDNYNNSNLMKKLENEILDEFHFLNNAFIKLSEDLKNANNDNKDLIINKHIPTSKNGDYDIYFKDYFLSNEINEVLEWGNISNLLSF